MHDLDVSFIASFMVFREFADGMVICLFTGSGTVIVHGDFEPKSHREPPAFYQAAAGGCEEAQQASPTHVAKHVQVNARACASRAQIQGR